MIYYKKPLQTRFFASYYKDARNDAWRVPPRRSDKAFFFGSEWVGDRKRGSCSLCPRSRPFLPPSLILVYFLLEQETLLRRAGIKLKARNTLRAFVINLHLQQYPIDMRKSPSLPQRTSLKWLWKTLLASQKYESCQVQQYPVDMRKPPSLPQRTSLRWLWKTLLASQKYGSCQVMSRSGTIETSLIDNNFSTISFST